MRRKFHIHTHLGICSLASLFISLWIAESAEAAVKVWSDTAITFSWSHGVNWVGGVAPVAGDDIVFPATAIPGITSNDLLLQIGSIRFESNGWTVLGGIITNTIGASGIRCTAGGGGTNTIGLVLSGLANGPLNLDAAAGCTLRITGQILGSGTVSVGEFGGTGTVEFTATNSMSGQVRVRSGLLDVTTTGGLRGGNSTAASGTIVESGATLRLAGGNWENEHLTLNGGDGQGSGAVITDGNVTWTAPIVINATSSVGVSAGGRFSPTQPLTGSGGLTKLGGGNMSLPAGSHTYAGPTVVSGGRFDVFGSAATSSTTVQSTATLGGTGTLTNGATVDSGGTLAPGASPGILNTGTLSLAAGSTLSTEINGTAAGTGHDQVNVTGPVGLGGATLSVALGFAPAAGDAFIIVANDGAESVSGTFSGLPEGASFVAGGTTFVISYIGGSGNDVVLTVPSAVPAMPSAGATALTALALLAATAAQLRRRRRA